MFKAGLLSLRQVAQLRPQTLLPYKSLIKPQLQIRSLQAWVPYNGGGLVSTKLTNTTTPSTLRTPGVLSPTTPNLTPRQSFSLTRHRNFSTLNRFQGKRYYSQGGRNNGPFPEIRYFRINPFTLFLGTLLSIGIFMMIIPIIFHLMLPLLIIGIVFYQFNKWRRGQFYQQLLRILPRSDILIPYRTVNLLQYSFLPEKVLMMNDFIKDMSKYGKFDNSVKSKREAINFVKFVETRIMESLAVDEDGIRSYLITNSSKFRWFQRLQTTPEFILKLDTVSFKTYGQRFGQSKDIMLSIQYPLKLILKNEDTLKTNNNQQIYLGTVTLTILDDSANKGFDPSFTLLSDLAKTNAKCKLVISIIPVSSLTRPIPKQFIISTWGDSGTTYRKYQTAKTKDGHTEYTVRE